MKITEVRTRVVQWEGETVPLPPHFCTNPMDLVSYCAPSMGNFAFHGWVLVEIFTNNGLVGLGNAALSPLVTKMIIDTYLKPVLLGADPWDTEFLWQQMYRRTLAFGRKGSTMAAIIGDTGPVGSGGGAGITAATRFSYSSGRPIQKSRPSGPATASWKKAPTDLPLARRTISPTVKPKLPSPITETHLAFGRPTQAPSAADIEKPKAP